MLGETNANELRADAAGIEEFLKLVGDELINIVCLDERSGGSKSTTGRNFADVASAVEYAVGRNAQRGGNVYWSVATLWRQPDNGKAVKEDVAHVRWLWVDIDPDPGEEVAVAQARLRRLAEHDLPAGVPPPTLVVSSGNGVQLFWALKEPVVMPRCTPTVVKDEKTTWQRPDDWEAARESIEARNNALLQKFGGDKAAKNIDRIMRLPGSVNWPDQKKRDKGRVPAMAEVIFYDAARVYALTDFELLATGSKSKSKAKSADTEGSARDGTQQDWEPDDKVKYSLRLLKVSKECKDKIRAFVPKGKRSEVMQWVVCELARAGIAPEVIFAVMTDKANPFSGHIYDQGSDWRAYAKRQVDWAYSEVDKEDEQRDLKAQQAEAERDAKKQRLLDLLNKEWFVAMVGGRTFIIRSKLDQQMQRRQLEFCSKQDFELKYGNEHITEMRGGILRSVPLGTWWLAHPQRREYDGLVFLPGQREVVNGERNLWSGWGVKPLGEGKWDLLQEHILSVVAQGVEAHRDYIINFLAWKVQNPAALPGVALVLYGPQGVGKTAVLEQYKMLWGQHGMKIGGTRLLTGRFNGHMRDLCVLFADEVKPAKGEDADATIKDLITGTTLTIDEKFVPAREVQNHVCLIMASDGGHVVNLERGTRRYAVFEVSSARKGDTAYFNALFAQMNAGGRERMLYDLMNRELGSFHPRDGIPLTEALVAQQVASLKGFDAALYEWIDQGSLPYFKPIVDGEEVKYLATDRLAEAYEERWGRKERESRISLQRVAKALKDAGFTPRDKNAPPGRGFVLPPTPRAARALWNEHRFPAFVLPPEEEDKERWRDGSTQT